LTKPIAGLTPTAAICQGTPDLDVEVGTVLLLGDIIRRHARDRPHKLAYVVGNARVTYSQLDAHANRFANVLAAHGVGHGDRVAFLAHNGVDYPAAYFAAARLGAILVPVSTRFRAAEVRYLLEHSESIVLAYAGEFAPLVAESTQGLPHLRHRFVLGDVDAGDGAPPLGPLLARASDIEPHVRVHEDDPHVMLYTSGTTGNPKGALCSHRSYCLQAAQTQAANHLDDDDIGVSMFPMFHMGGWALPLGFWCNGGTAVLVERADPEALLAVIAREKATYFYAVPTVYAHMLELGNFERYDISSLRRISGGTAAMTEAQIRAITERFATTTMSIMYGSTEAGAVSQLKPRHLFQKPTSVGRPMLGVDIRILHPDGSECTVGEAGEVTVRSEFIMRGYWMAPEATAATIRDGWVHTGDLATVDAEGFMHIAGRIKEMIKSGGENIFPAEVERVLVEHPGILEAAVLGVPDAEWTETPVAAVVLRPGAILTEAEVIDYVRGRLASFKKPRYVRFLDTLPRTASTRQVQKTVLREMLLPTLPDS
jgi:acyl-CoA synthetase (AMP-forming)/AMP-acid ligase II